MRVVLIGMKGCGKSTLGHQLAQRSGCIFYDTDHLLEQAWGERTGRSMSFREIFAQEGPEAFERLEEQVVNELADRLAADEPAVVALGGRTALNPRLAGPIHRLGTVVYLDNEPAELLRRARELGQLPAFLDPADPDGSFLRLHRERAPQYRATADLTLHLTGLGIREALDKLQEIIEAHHGR